MKKILIVEDDQQLSVVLKEKLEKEGFEIFTAYNGQEALEILDSHTVDLILLDIVMPKMDGNEMMFHLKERGQEISTIMLTNLQNAAIPDGVVGVMTKVSTSLEEVVARVRQQLKQ